MKTIKTLVALAVVTSFGLVSLAQAADATPPAATTPAAVAPAKTEATKPMVKKHHHKVVKKAGKTTAKAESAPAPVLTAKAK